MRSIGWKLNRLRAMRSEEFVYRLWKMLQGLAEAHGVGLAQPSTPITMRGCLWECEVPFNNSLPYIEAADQIFIGQFNIFACVNCYLGFPPQWNNDPQTGTISPLQFGKTLNYRDASIVGNIKYLWEPNRHLELVTLAQAFHLTQDAKYAHACHTLLTSWFAQCPYPLGPNWTSTLELAVRLLNWAFAWQLLGGQESILFRDKASENFKQLWLKSIYQHCHFIAGHFSRYSSANNHLFGEYMGLFVGSTVWPCWKESASWQKISKAGLEEEALRQNAPDGCNREQGFWYHHEVADMMLLCGLVGRANEADFSEAFWGRLEEMLAFIAALMDVAGNVPMIGDSDDAVMIRFVPDHDFPVYKSLLATGAVLFNRPDFAAKAGVFDDKSRWLLGDERERQFTELLRRANLQQLSFRREFPDGGYYILGKDLETEREVKLIADAGPLGYLSIAAHGHADALAMTLSIAGRELLIDPGTYAYHTERKWRDYFKGTSAHNTVRIDGLDQSVSGGNFMWLKHAEAQREIFQTNTEQDVFLGSHDGYTRLKDPVGHARRIELLKTANRIEIMDLISCKATHHMEIFWHFAETCSVKISDQTVLVHNDDVRLEMTMPGSTWGPRLYQGDEALPLGWVSRRFDVKVPAPTIVWQADISGDQQLLTVLQYKFNLWENIED